MHGFGVEDTEISPRELAEMWPLARTDDVLSAFSWPTRAAPTRSGWRPRWPRAPGNSARAWSRASRPQECARTAAGRATRVTAVLTEQGEIETEVVVNAAGMWARQFGALTGVHVPLQAAEHYYLLTDTVAGMDADLPVIEDPDSYGYYRPEGDGMLVGLFEPVGAPWSLDGVRASSRSASSRRTGSGWSRTWPRRWSGSRAWPRPGCGPSSAGLSRSPATCGHCSARRLSSTGTSSRPA